jgi:hypothetical protein
VKSGDHGNAAAEALALVPAVRRFALLPLPLDALHPSLGGLDGRAAAAEGVAAMRGKDGDGFLSPHRQSGGGSAATSVISPEEAAAAGRGFSLLNNLTRFKW